MRSTTLVVLALTTLGLVACGSPASPVQPTPPPIDSTPQVGGSVAQDLVIPVILTGQFFQPSELSVNLGDTVTLQVSAADQAHVVKIADYTLEQAVEVGKPIEFKFMTFKKGDILVECTLNCAEGTELVVTVN